MAKTDFGRTATATRDDIESILGKIDADKLLEILSLRPSINDVERASLWMSGDADVFGDAEPLKYPASEIVTILTADEEEETGAR